LALSSVLEAQIAVVFGPDHPAFVLDRITAIENPLQAERPHSLPWITGLVWISPRPACVVYARPHAVLGCNFSERHPDRRVNLPVDIDALAGRKGGVEVSGILEFELGSTHSMLPSSVLSESGSRGRSLRILSAASIQASPSRARASRLP